MRSNWLLLLFSWLLVCVSCEKVPIREHRGQFETLAAHWFANEKTQYVFFSIGGLRPGQARLSWPAEFELQIPDVKVTGLNVQKDGFARLDFSAGVHKHRLVECGGGRLCGSFSFRVEQPVRLMTIRYRYNAGSPMLESAVIATSTHPDTGNADAQSALIYGVFNSDNSRVQVRVHDNFGTPNSEEIAHYGMERTFEILYPQSMDIAPAEHKSTQAQTGSPFLFPATPCTDAIRNSVKPLKFAGTQSWLPIAFDPNDAKGAVCFRARALDAKGKTLNEEPALARRNPVLLPESLTVRPPLREAIRIPIVLSYCQGRPGSEANFSPAFLDYQRFILEVPTSTIDACFAIHEEDRFALDLQRVMNAKLAAAGAANKNDDDYFFTVIMHHNLPKKITKFQEIVAETLSKVIGDHVARVSPRVVGAFVYDSQAVDLRKFSRSPAIVWCPRKEAEKPQQQDAESDVDPSINCTPRGAGDVTLGPFNFLVPMGPFPNLSTYMDAYTKYGNRGQAKDPHLAIQAVHTNEYSFTDPQSERLFTFFDGERISLLKGERMRFCRDRDPEFMLEQLAFRPDGSDSVLSTEEVQKIATGEGDVPTLNVGLWWDAPFIGGFSYTLPLAGKVFGLIPLSRNYKSRQPVGDARWRRGTWNLSPMLQKCLRHCDHPYFDEAGSYQIRETWRETSTCPTPKTPEPQT